MIAFIEQDQSTRLLEVVFAGIRTPVTVRLPSGAVWQNAASGDDRCVIEIHDDDVLRDICLNHGSADLAQLYIDGRIDVEGDLSRAVALADELLAVDLPLRAKLAVGRALTRHALRDWVGRVSAAIHSSAALRASTLRTRSAVQFHYDRPAQFWKLWLDPSLTYSCAYFRSDDDTLEQAQFAKHEHICRKLGLQPGMRLFDLGCGWGSLAIHAAQQHGAFVHGVTLSPAQRDYADRRIRALGLHDRCTIELRDYRDVTDAGAFDCVTSIGAVEHVQREELTPYFQFAENLLKPGGRFLNHGIALGTATPLAPPHSMSASRHEFIDASVFPDSSLVSIDRMLAAAAATRLETRDVECLREHYAMTLARWRSNLEARRGDVERTTDEKTFRLFRLYLCACERGFRIGNLSLYQTLLVKCDSGRSGMPLTRSGWYVR